MFDLDGTLIDSMPSFSRVMTSVLDDENIKYDSDLIKIITPLGYEKTAEYMQGLGVKRSKEQILDYYKTNLYKAYSEEIKLKSGVKEFLTHLKNNGARLFVLTASPHLVTNACLKNNGVFDYFEKVWSVDDFGLNKSDTHIFIKAVERIGCKTSDVNYFEDNVTAVKNAKKAGYKVYAVYDRHPQEDVKELLSVADVFVEDYKKLFNKEV